MSTFRVNKTTNYVTMSNYHLRDKNLSLKAKGLLSWMLSNDDDWDYSLAGIVACCKEGETTVNTALRELQEFGYVEIIKKKPDETNNRIHYDYNVYEVPQGVDFLGLESQGVENPGQINNKIRNTKKSNKLISKDIVSPKFKLGTKNPKKPTMWDKCVGLIDDFTGDDLLRGKLEKALSMFIANSKESNIPFYTNTFKGKLNTLSELSQDTGIQTQIVNQTIDKGWNNFYELKTNKKQSVHDRLNESGVANVPHAERDVKEDLSEYEKF